MEFAQAMSDHKMVPSKNEAKRLIQQGAVSARFADESLWFPVDDPQLELLEPFPDLYLRVGNGFWRCVKDGKKGEAPFSQYPGIVKVPGVAVNGKFITEIPLSLVRA